MTESNAVPTIPEGMITRNLKMREQETLRAIDAAKRMQREAGE